jgi:GT2 family glycosyltransferase
MNDKCTIARVDGNMGFLYASKLGLYVSDGDIKILMNNDVIVSGDFIPMVEKQIADNEMSLVGNNLIAYKTGWNDFGDKVFPYLEGYFLAASKKFWGEMDFDVQYAPADMEDVDLSTQAYKAGYPVISLNTPFLKHLGASTYGYNSLREAVTKINKEKFKTKWL